MNAYSTRFVSSGAALALAGLLCGATALAQGTAQNLPQPQVSTESCAQVQWSPQLQARYPRIADACQEVIAVNGENWARIEGRLIRVNTNGSVTSVVLDRQGRPMGRLTLKPAAGQKVLLDGAERSFDDLQTGAVLNMYIPERMYAVATEPSAPASEMAEIEPASSEQTEVAQMPAELPHTAGPLPWVLLAGGGLVLVGLGLSLRRRFARFGSGPR